MCQNKYKTKFALLFERMSLPISTDKKETKIFLQNKEIQKGAVAKSYMTNGLLIYD